MSNRLLPAKLSAKCCPLAKMSLSPGEQESHLNQWFMPALACPPCADQNGEQETYIFQLLKPASKIPRLTTCARLGEHIVGRGR